MLTIRGADDYIHSRAMLAANDTFEDGLVFEYLGNLDSGKFDDLAHNPKVNISYSDGCECLFMSCLARAPSRRGRLTITCV